MEQKPIKDYTDLELAKILNEAYAQLQVAQGNIMAANQEIQRRETEKKVDLNKLKT